MPAVLLVSAQKVKNFTEVNENVDEILLLSNIQISQDIGLQTILGTKFYNHILNAAQNNTLTGPETTLVQDYIAPYLLWQATYEALPTLWMRVMNKSVIVGNTEQGSPVNQKDLIYLRELHSSRAQFYAQRLMDYLKNHPSDFPDYYSWSSTDGMAPSKINYYAGLHIEPGMRKLPRVGTGWKTGYGNIPVYFNPTDSDCCVDY
jgi:hypothetical protein